MAVKRPVLFVLACLLLVGLALSALGCGGNDGGDEPTLEQYFTEVDAAFERALEGVEDLIVLSTMVMISRPWEETRAGFAALANASGEFLTEFDAIDPPLAAEALHTEYSEALHAASDTIRTISEFESDAELAALLEDRIKETPTQRSGAAVCSELNSVAQEGGIDVELPCLALSR